MTAIFSQPLIAIIVFIGLLVFVHEFGHFIVGKLCGIGVEVFSIGFGPSLFSFTRNGTEYRFAILPLGGFVKFAGALPSEDVPPRFKGMEMHKASRWARTATIFAGPFANLVLAVVAYTALGFGGIKYLPAIIGQVLPQGAGAQAGLLPGDEVVSIDGEPLRGWEELRTLISESAGKPLHMTVLRRNAAGLEKRDEVRLEVTPESQPGEDQIGRQVMVGRAGISFGYVPPIISVLREDSLVALSGLQTGDEIKELSAKKGTEVFSRTIASWQDLREAFRQAWQQGSDDISLRVGDRVVVVNVREFWAKKGRYEGPRFDITRIDGALRELGIVDSQLTLATPEKGLQGVLQKGDRLVAFAGQKIENVFDLQEALMKNKSPEVEVTVQRGFSMLSFKAPLEPVDQQKVEGKVTYFALPATFLGQPIAPPLYEEVYSNPLAALGFGVRETIKHASLIGQMLWGLARGQVPLKALGGPILIAKVAGEAVELGWRAFFGSLALISINLGMINLFPLPALDGGQLILVLAEALKRKPLAETAIENFQRIGFVMIMALVVLATYNDLSRFWTSMLKGVVGFFE